MPPDSFRPSLVRICPPLRDASAVGERTARISMISCQIPRCYCVSGVFRVAGGPIVMIALCNCQSGLDCCHGTSFIARGGPSSMYPPGGGGARHALHRPLPSGCDLGRVLGGRVESQQHESKLRLPRALGFRRRCRSLARGSGFTGLQREWASRIRYIGLPKS